jgi:hypothetical protein
MKVSLLVLALAASGGGAAHAAPLFTDASASLPAKEGRGHAMSARAADVDKDGDLDLVIAMEYGANRLLLNDGAGRFSDASARLPRDERDSEEIALLDADKDGDIDIAVGNEDDLKQELYLNDGRGNFANASDRLKVHVKANAALAIDVDKDGREDLFFGGDKVSALLMNKGRAQFTDESWARLPSRFGANQDVAPGDVDGDGDVDLVLGNEDGNQIYLNDGKGFFFLTQGANLPRPPRPEETRDVELFDVDGDGDLDIFFANVRLWNPQGMLQNRLLLNDGKGVFADATAAWLPSAEIQTLSAAPVDVDGDGRIDLITTTLVIDGGLKPCPVRAYRNTGAAFEDVTRAWLPEVSVAGFDATLGDFNKDGVVDVFVSSRGGPDALLLGVKR